MGGIVKLGAASVLSLAVIAVAGCGGSGDSTDVSSTQAAFYPWIKGPTRQFLVRGGDNIVQTFGREATAAERKQASTVIAAWMRARAAQDWPKDCSYLSKGYRKTITEDAHGVSNGKVETCPQALAYFGHRASGDYVDNLSGPIDSLRIGEGHGYAQYHGNDGKDWIIAVDRDSGRWKVAVATPLDRNK